MQWTVFSVVLINNVNGNMKSVDFRLPTNGTSKLAVSIPERSEQAQRTFEETPLSLVHAMQYSKAALNSYQEVDKSGHMLSSRPPKSHDNLSNCKLYGTNIILDSRVNALIKMASPWSHRGNGQRDKYDTGSDVRGATKLFFFYNTDVLGSEGTTDQFWQIEANDQRGT